MAVFKDYLERARGIERTFPADASGIKRVGIKLLALIAANESESWRAFSIVDSPQATWNQGGREELANDLKEILDEPEPIS